MVPHLDFLHSSNGHTLHPLNLTSQGERRLTQSRDYPAKFDFIHTRVTLGCWSDMKNEIIQRSFDHLQPGGWLECQEIPAPVMCDDGTLPEDFGWLRWVRDFRAGGQVANRQVDLGPQLTGWMHEVGFVDIHEMTFKIPINGWPKEMRLKHIGMMWQRNLLEGLSGFSLGMFNQLGKTVEEIEVSNVAARRGRTPLISVAALPSGGTERPIRPQRPCLPQSTCRLGPEAGRVARRAPQRAL